jgi:hypothetical protein
MTLGVQDLNRASNRFLSEKSPKVTGGNKVFAGGLEKALTQRRKGAKKSGIKIAKTRKHEDAKGD